MIAWLAAGMIWMAVILYNISSALRRQEIRLDGDLWDEPHPRDLE